jgi:hypothetical protein
MNPEAELLAREPLFHVAGSASTCHHHSAEITEDFWEVGASGSVYTRDEVLEVLWARGKVQGDETWIVSEPGCRQLAEDTFALTYLLDQNGRLTRRLTLWRRDHTGWRALYHQGTLVQPLQQERTQ